MEKTIYEITQDELNFLYAHNQKLLETVATLNNLVIMQQSQIEILKDEKANRKQ
jgi:hypothetical protein